VKFLADENVDQPIVECLRKDGHSVLSVTEMEQSISDDEVIYRANQEQAMLLTADKDFGELVFRQARVLNGVVLIRLAGLSLEHKAEVVAIAIKEHVHELAQNFTVISPGAVRIRKQVS
jgi:predicted nuclease of predicted toxin-antitoxin system